jgi:C-terminal processing protease CtpA/Prc
MMNRSRPMIIRLGLRLMPLVAVCLASIPARSQGLSEIDRARGRQMLSLVREDLQKHYYDPTYRDLNLEERFREAEDKIGEAESNGQVFGIIAQVLLDLDDSHTYFIPPVRASTVDYGWAMQMVGERCCVTRVDPGSDAAAKGLKAGDVIRKIDQYTIERGRFWVLEYLYQNLRPRTEVHLEIRRPDGSSSTLAVQAAVHQGLRVVDTGSYAYLAGSRDYENWRRNNRPRLYEQGRDLLVWKMPVFDPAVDDIQDVMGKARKHQALILDLRGNPGGSLGDLQRLLGYFVGRDAKIGELRGRDRSEAIRVKSRGKRNFTGRLVVLVDSKSTSASELFARVMQIEKRATVIGDRTLGRVMAAQRYTHAIGPSSKVVFGVAVTEADIFLWDGRSLEGKGVAPDERVLPTPEDLAAGRDPVLARAAELLGVSIDLPKAIAALNGKD